jgi:hypothetical protein
MLRTNEKTVFLSAFPLFGSGLLLLILGKYNRFNLAFLFVMNSLILILVKKKWDSIKRFINSLAPSTVDAPKCEMGLWCICC